MAKNARGATPEESFPYKIYTYLAISTSGFLNFLFFFFIFYLFFFLNLPFQ